MAGRVAQEAIRPVFYVVAFQHTVQLSAIKRGCASGERPLRFETAALAVRGGFDAVCAR